MQKSDPLISPSRRGEERAEDQLDRLAETIRLTVARAAQLEASEQMARVESPQFGCTSRTSEGLEGAELREWEGKTPCSQSELGCMECEEVEEYWRGLLDRAMMEQEDIRSYAVILVQRSSPVPIPAKPSSPYTGKANLASLLTISLSPATNDSPSFPDFPLTLSPTPCSPDSFHQQDVDEAYFRLQYYQKHVMPRDIAKGIEEEKRYLRRVGQIRRNEVEKLIKARRELENTTEELQEELKKVRISKELFFKNRNRHLRSSTSPSLFHESPTQSPDIEYLSKEISQVIDGINWEKPSKSKETKGEIGNLELRCKLAIAVIEDKTGDSESIQREITSISQTISQLNPRIFGVRRVQTLLAFARSRLSAQQSHIQLSSARETLRELSKSLNCLEKMCEKEKKIEGKLSFEGVFMHLETEKAYRLPRPSSTTASSLPTLSDISLCPPHLEEKYSASKWTNLIETVKTQEELIGKLREELGNALIRLKEADMREIRVRERETGLKTAERQLVVLREYMDKRIARNKVAEGRLKVRERAIMGVIAAADTLSAVKTMVLDMQERLETQETTLNTERNATEQLNLQLQSTQEALTCKAHYLRGLQRLLGRQHSLQVQEKAKLDSIRVDLTRLLPTLQRCEGCN